jgi:hypothetical protein
MLNRSSTSISHKPSFHISACPIGPPAPSMFQLQVCHCLTWPGATGIRHELPVEGISSPSKGGSMLPRQCCHHQGPRRGGGISFHGNLPSTVSDNIQYIDIQWYTHINTHAHRDTETHKHTQTETYDHILIFLPKQWGRPLPKSGTLTPRCSGCTKVKKAWSVKGWAQKGGPWLRIDMRMYSGCIVGCIANFRSVVWQLFVRLTDWLLHTFAYFSEGCLNHQAVFFHSFALAMTNCRC